MLATEGTLVEIASIAGIPATVGYRQQKESLRENGRRQHWGHYQTAGAQATAEIPPFTAAIFRNTINVGMPSIRKSATASNI